jgi:hypothetical protein
MTWTAGDYVLEYGVLSGVHHFRLRRLFWEHDVNLHQQTFKRTTYLES